MKVDDVGTKWQNPATLGTSYGYMEWEEKNDAYKSPAKLVHLLCDVVSKNGNLLLNIGPRADGTIPDGMQMRLLAIGEWLQTNGEAIYGTRPWVTPNLNRLAKEGIRFTDFYSAAPVCSPARVGLLTGRSPNRAGVYDWIPHRMDVHMRSSEVTIPLLLKQAGYATCMSGKWHCNSKFNSPTQPQPVDAGFDHWFGTQNNAAPSHENPINFVRNGEAVGPLEGFSCQLVVDEAGQTIKEPISSLDFLPTFCELAGTQPPADLQLDGTSFLPALEGKPLFREKPLLWVYYRALNERQVAMRDGEWKVLARLNFAGKEARLNIDRQRTVNKENEELVKNATLSDFQLFHVVDDTDESEDLSKSNPEKLAELKERLEKYYKELVADSYVWGENK